LVIICIVFVVWQGFLRKEVRPSEDVGPQASAVSPGFKKVEIDWQLLEDPRIAEFIPFEEVPPYEDEIGRENPFVPY